MESDSYAEASVASPPRTLLIDTDVHEVLHSVSDLIPYIEPHWRLYLEGTAGKWAGHGLAATYAMPVSKNAAREDWNLSDGTAGTDPDMAAQHLFHGEGISHAILNGFFHISRLEHDYEFSEALAAAYNNWQIDNWLERDSRFMGSVHVVAHNPDVAAREIDRVAAHPQIVQVFLPTVDNREYGDPMYRPIFEAALRNDLVVALHHGGHTRTVLGFPRYFAEWHTLAAPHANMAQITSLVFNGTFETFPDLKVVVLEAGVSWLPWLMRRMDQQYKELRSNVPWVKHMPSEHIRNSIRISTQPMTDVTPEEFVQLVDMVQTGDVFMFSSDYPHWDADSPSRVLGKHIPQALRDKIRYGNAVATYPRLSGLVR